MNNIPKITVIGSMTMDLIAKTERRPIKGETIIGNDFGKVPGGKGANQAVTAAKLGMDVYMVGRLGQNDIFTDTILENLKKEGLNTDYIKLDDTTSTGIAHIIVDGQGDNSIVIIPQANGNVGENDVDEVEQLIADSDILMLQLEIPLKTVVYAAKIAKKHHVKVILNPAPAQTLPEELYQYIDYLTPNESETEILTGIKVTNLDTAKEAAANLIERGTNNVVITLGENGCLLMNASETLHVPAYQVDVIDTTAAGDAFNGGMAAALAEGNSNEEAVRYGGLAGTLAVTKFGAQSSLPSLEDIIKFKERAVHN